MAIPVEQFTCPGKYAIDLSFEQIKRELEKPKKILKDIVERFYISEEDKTKYNRKQN